MEDGMEIGKEIIKTFTREIEINSINRCGSFCNYIKVIENKKTGKVKFICTLYNIRIKIVKEHGQYNFERYQKCIDEFGGIE